MMNFFKVLVVLWACSTAFVAAGPASKRLDAWEVTQQYCGELLQSAIQIVCKGSSQKISVVHFEKQERNKFIINACCTKTCNLKFIKAHCPGQRIKLNKKNILNNPAGTTAPALHSTIKTITTTAFSTTLTNITKTTPPPTPPKLPASQKENHGLWYYMLLPLYTPFYSNFYLP